MRWVITQRPDNMNEDMVISKRGLDFIKKHEGFRNHPYLDPVGIPTIGYGFTYYLDGTRVTMDDEPLTMLKATEMLLKVVEIYEDAVNELVEVELTQNQFDALVSFTFNVGSGAFKNSTLLKRINNDPNDPDIDYQFKRWNKAGGKVLKGLKKRRNMEAWMYFEHIRNEEDNQDT